MTTAANTKTIDLEQALAGFLRALQGRNRSSNTLAAYRSDLTQFLDWLGANNATAAAPDQIERADITEYLAYLASQRVSGVSRARKLAAIRELFRYLQEHELVDRSPTLGI